MLKWLRGFMTGFVLACNVVTIYIIMILFELRVESKDRERSRYRTTYYDYRKSEKKEDEKE